MTWSRKTISIFISIVMVMAMAFPVSSYAAEEGAVQEQASQEISAVDTAADSAASEAPADTASSAQADAQATTTATPVEDATATETASAATEGAGFSPMATTAAGEFEVEGAEDSYTYSDGVLTVHKDVTISTTGSSATNQRVVIADNAKVTLAGVNIAAGATAAGITVKAGVKAVLELLAGSVNKVAGGKDHAGIEVGYDYDANSGETVLAELAIEGDGTLEATGGSNSAGIGGSYTNKSDLSGKNIAGYCGDIIINSGTIIANGGNGGAGIGSAGNSGRNSDGTTHSASAKMAYDVIGSITINNGNVTAKGGSNGAGIGGGNHADSGKVTINGGTIDAKGDSGIGSGLGSSKDDGLQKGPGSYFGDITINGGDVTAYATNNMGAGIGGGMYGDGFVTINGGTVNASVSTSGNAYQGGAGIGGGYQGAAIVAITGGIVNAIGGNGSAGIGNGALAAITTSSKYSEKDGWTGVKNVRTGNPAIAIEDAKVEISGGTVTAQGGYAGAGIGSGNSCEWCSVIISGGTVTAIGYASDEATMEGAAGIGSGAGYVKSKQGYMKETSEHIAITGGTVIAIGGWGAAGIGSGASNEMADSIAIDAENASVQAYADGTKLAIDTPFDETAGSNVAVTGNLLQGTFVHKYTDTEGNVEGTEGLESILVTNDATGDTKELTLMPAGYRSYGTDVVEPGIYTINTKSGAIGDSGTDGSGNGAFFSVFPTVDWNADTLGGKSVQYGVAANVLSNYLYLFPVKTIVVDKQLAAADLPAGQTSEQFLAGVNQTFYFAIADYKGNVLLDGDGNPWIEAIKVVDGVPQGNAYFANMNDGKFEIWEADADGNRLAEGTQFGDMVLKAIATVHGSGNDNNAELAKGVWIDAVTVINTFAPVAVDPVDPVPPVDPVDPVSPVKPAGPASPTPAAITPAAPGGPATTAFVGMAAPNAAPAGPTAIAGNGTPLAASAATESIADDAAPLAAGDHDIWCWVHWWIILGIIVTAAYSLVVIVRRRRNSNELANIDNDVMGGTSSVSSPKTTPSFVPQAQPVMTAKLEA